MLAGEGSRRKPSGTGSARKLDENDFRRLYRVTISYLQIRLKAKTRRNDDRIAYLKRGCVICKKKDMLAKVHEKTIKIYINGYTI